MILFSAIVAVALVGPPPDADEGVKAFAEGRYEDAARILERAYAAEPQLELLFAWAQAERYAGHCDVAVPLYREYLGQDPPADVRALARGAIEACGEDPDAAVEPEPTPSAVEEPAAEPEPAPEPAPAPAPAPASRRRDAFLDPWGHALTWSGVAVAAVGAGLLGEAHRRRAMAQSAPHEQAYRDALEGAPTLSRVGIAVLAGGGALLVAGVIRFSVVAARGSRTEARLRPSGAGLVWKFELAPRRRRVLR